MKLIHLKRAAVAALLAIAGVVSQAPRTAVAATPVMPAIADPATHVSIPGKVRLV